MDVVLHELGIIGLHGHDSSVFLDIALLLFGNPGIGGVAHSISNLVQYDMVDVALVVLFNVVGTGIYVDEARLFIVVGAILDKVVEPGADVIELGRAEELLDVTFVDSGQVLVLTVQGGAFGVLVLLEAVLVVHGQGAVELGIDVVIVLIGPTEVEAVRLLASVDLHNLVGPLLDYGCGRNCHVQPRNR